MSLTTAHDRPIRLDGRVAVVTGAGNGLGRQYARALGRLGAKVVVNDLGGDVHGVGSDRTVAQTVVAEIRAAGGDAVADGHSVATPEGGAAIIDAAVQAYGRVDVLGSSTAKQQLARGAVVRRQPEPRFAASAKRCPCSLSDTMVAAPAESTSKRL